MEVDTEVGFGGEEKGVPDGSKPNPKGGRHTVMCIDDDPQILSALYSVLRREPYLVLASHDPYEVLGLVQKIKVSLAIVDQHMPNISGIELGSVIKEFSPSTLVMIITGFETDQIENAINDGLVEMLIKKPWNEEELKGNIQDLLVEYGRRNGN
jgi:response regulator RpfG family c-di-GMP phosphodiesterase